MKQQEIEIIIISIALIVCNLLLNITLYYVELFIWLKILISVLFAFACGCVFIASLLADNEKEKQGVK